LKRYLHFLEFSGFSKPLGSGTAQVGTPSFGNTTN
jgi:hypothetical protein